MWGIAISKSKERIEQQLKEPWKYAETIASGELKDSSPTTFEKVDSQKVEENIEQINRALRDKDVDTKVRQKLNYAKKNWPNSTKKYREQEELLGERN